MNASVRRKPRVFDIDDPALSADDPAWTVDENDEASQTKHDPMADAGTGEGRGRSGIRWGALFLSALTGLAGLALTIWLTDLVAQALAAPGLLGWLATSLIAILAIAAVGLAVREVFGMMRLARLGDLRRSAQACADIPDFKTEQRVIREVAALYTSRPDMTWQLRKLKEHQDDVADPGDMLRLADADLMAGLDAQARQIILKSARRIAVVTALMPILLVDVLFVVFENLRMLRALATLYGGRPGFFGSLKLFRMVFANLVAAGGIALTDDLIGQMFGQDMLRRLSHRLGEGAVNGTLCARIGVAAVGVVRPLPHVETPPVRLRDILAELFKREAGEDTKPGPRPRTGQGRT